MSLSPMQGLDKVSTRGLRGREVPQECLKRVAASKDQLSLGPACIPTVVTSYRPPILQACGCQRTNAPPLTSQPHNILSPAPPRPQPSTVARGHNDHPLLHIGLDHDHDLLPLLVLTSPTLLPATPGRAPGNESRKEKVHTLVGAGVAEGAIDAATILNPALARGELQYYQRFTNYDTFWHVLKEPTTIDEYRKHIEKDPALERRFQPVKVLSQRLMRP
uniref:Uncharacterized protein n=1 Tax=Leersia perrieri TaxID=77586 RepID=A0A0D9XR51_9ORYZ